MGRGDNKKIVEVGRHLHTPGSFKYQAREMWLQLVNESVSCSVVSDSLQPHGATGELTRLLCPWDSPGKNSAVGNHSQLQGIFLTQGSNPGLLHCRHILYHLSYQGSPFCREQKCVPLGDVHTYVYIMYTYIHILASHAHTRASPPHTGFTHIHTFPQWLSSKEFACCVGEVGLIPDREDPLKKDMATYSSILAWKIPSTEEPGGLQAVGCKESNTTE